jgi:hypothetical protein
VREAQGSSASFWNPCLRVAACCRGRDRRSQRCCRCNVAKAFAATAHAVRQSELPVLCRFSDAGIPGPSTRSDGRRPKSAKARPGSSRPAERLPEFRQEPQPCGQCLMKCGVDWECRLSSIRSMRSRVCERRLSALRRRRARGASTGTLFNPERTRHKQQGVSPLRRSLGRRLQRCIVWRRRAPPKRKSLFAIGARIRKAIAPPIISPDHPRIARYRPFITRYLPLSPVISRLLTGERGHRPTAASIGSYPRSSPNQASSA